MVGTRLFRSRWAALLWAGGVLWTAYDVATAARDGGGEASASNATIDATGMAVDAKDLAALAGAGNAD